MGNDFDDEVRYKNIDMMLVASMELDYVGKKENLEKSFKTLRETCGDKIDGRPFLMLNWGKKSENGLCVEACYPVKSDVSTEEVSSWVFQDGESFTLKFKGKYEDLDESYKKIFNFASEHGVQPGMNFLEVYLSGIPAEDKEYEIELVMILHPWFALLFDSVESILGPDAIIVLLNDLERITPLTNQDERFMVVREIMEKLDEMTDEEQRYEVLSRCADFYPDTRIEELRAVYEKDHSVDDVLGEMNKEQDWFSKPWREGREIHIIKVPHDKKNYESAKTPEEKRKYYCHCPMIRDSLDEGMPAIFCYCGTGWIRQQWEGILGIPLKVRLIRSLLKGDDVCEFAVELPEEIEVD